MKIENVVVISLEDYTEYQELKNKKKEIDFSRLKTGSVVKLRTSLQGCSGYEKVDFKNPFDVVFFKTKHLINGESVFTKESTYNSYCTFHQNGNYVLFASHEKIDYITEVISY